ncbi:hypothetical protein [Bacilliculturomica massiliensis]|uniref:hypothetical protein n=1 Tax=Bacilliculturomica massiliensis TaxID=1917867 RepID=UPI001030D66E|nr:hypothetical protein [Bacilliculturomica massiliensis]
MKTTGFPVNGQMRSQFFTRRKMLFYGGGWVCYGERTAAWTTETFPAEKLKNLKPFEFSLWAHFLRDFFR